MDYWEKKIAECTSDDPKEILKRDKEIFDELRKENASLKEDVRRIAKSNENFVKLVEMMEEKVKKLTEDVRKSYVYSYEKGGWMEKEALDEGKIELAPSQLSVDSINNQLAEILRMIERYRIKE
jgi:uncharacterized membrane protein